MARETGSQRRARTTRDPIAELKARIARLKKNLGGTSSRGRSSQQNLIKTLEKRLTKYEQNKRQFGNVWGNRKNENPIGRGVSKNRKKPTPVSERDQDGYLKPGIVKETVFEKGKGTTSTTTKDGKKINETLKVNQKTTKESNTKSENNAEKLKSTAPKKEEKSQAQKDWEKKSKNSPARASGAFTDKQLWERRKQHLESIERRKKAREERRKKRLKSKK